MPALNPLSPTRTTARTTARPTVRPGSAAAVPALLVALLLGAAACTGSGSGSSSGSVAGASVVDQGGGGGGVAADAGGGAVTAPGAGATTDADPAALAGEAARAVVSTATLGVRVQDLEVARTAVEDLATGAGGVVAASRAGGSGEPDDGGQAQLTLRVPSTAFDGVLDGIAALGRQTDRTTSATDVTAEVADVDSRVASARAVLATFRDQLPQARTIPDVLAVEGEIARRQADLEALQARQRVLADQVALATVEVTLTRGPASAAAAAQPGFAGGLGAGWHALGEFLRVASVVVGAVIPFAVPVALVAVPLLLLRRRRTRPPAPAE